MELINKNIVIFGAGAIGEAFAKELSKANSVTLVSHREISVSHRTPKINITTKKLDYLNEDSLKSLAECISKTDGIHLAIATNGILHSENFGPEKSLKDLSLEKFETVFKINTIVPALIMKYFVPLLSKDRGIFAAISARVGSISDNALGGWYAYRASKAALNMLIKCSAIEASRKNPSSIIVGLHPGTVDSELSKPFQSSVKTLFTPEESVNLMLTVLRNLTPRDTGKCYAYDGQEILP